MRITEIILEDEELDEISALGAGQKVGKFGGNIVQGTKNFFTGVKQGYKQARTGQPAPQPTAPAGQASQPAAQPADQSSAAGQASQPAAQRQDLGFGFNGQTGEPFKSSDERAEYFKQQGVQDPGYKGSGQPAAGAAPAADQQTAQQPAAGAAPAADASAAPAADQQTAQQPAAMKAADIVKGLNDVWSKATADQGSETTAFPVQNQIRSMAKNAGMAGQTVESQISRLKKLSGIQKKGN